MKKTREMVVVRGGSGGGGGMVVFGSLWRRVYGTNGIRKARSTRWWNKIFLAGIFSGDRKCFPSAVGGWKEVVVALGDDWGSRWWRVGRVGGDWGCGGGTTVSGVSRSIDWCKKLGCRKIFPARVAGIRWCRRQVAAGILKERERENWVCVCVII